MLQRGLRIAKFLIKQLRLVETQKKSFEHSEVLNFRTIELRKSFDISIEEKTKLTILYKGQPLVQSHFIMVARCPQTGRAAPVVPLKPETEAEIRNYKLAEKLNKVIT